MSLRQHLRSIPSLAAFALAICSSLIGCHDDDLPDTPDCSVTNPSHGGKGGSGGKNASGSGGATAKDAGGDEDAGDDAPDADVRDSGDDSGSNGSGGNGSGGNGSGGNGSGGNGSGGNGSGGSNGDPDAGLGDPAACAACEEQYPTSDTTCTGLRDQCLSAQGNAAGGLKQGAPKAELCRDVLACFFQTKCVDPFLGWTPCVCGAGADPNACAQGSIDPTGPCKDEFFAAAEITPEQFGTALYNNHAEAITFASGLATQLVGCDQYTCPFECGICTPETGSGPEGDETCHPRTAPDGGT